MAESGDKKKSPNNVSKGDAIQLTPRASSKSTNVLPKTPAVKQEPKGTPSSISRSELRRSARTRIRPSAEPEVKQDETEATAVANQQHPSKFEQNPTASLSLPPPVQSLKPPSTPKPRVELNRLIPSSNEPQHIRINGENFNGMKTGHNSLPFQFTTSNPTVAGSVLTLANNSDLTIIPILNPCTTQQQTPSVAVKPLVSSRNDLTITPSSVPLTSVPSSPLRSSRRLSQRRSVDSKSDGYDSMWDGAESSVQNAIHAMDMDDKSNQKPTSCQSQQFPNINSSPGKKPAHYKSQLLEKFNEALQKPKGQLPPQVGDVSIEPIPSARTVPGATEGRDVTLEPRNNDKRPEWNGRSPLPLNSGTTTISVIKTEDGSPKVSEMKLSKNTVKKLNGQLDQETPAPIHNGYSAAPASLAPPPISNNNFQISTPTDSKKKKPKPNKLSIFAPQLNSERAKLRSGSTSSGSESPKKSPRTSDAVLKTPEAPPIKLEPKSARKTPKTPKPADHTPDAVKKPIPLSPRVQEKEIKVGRGKKNENHRPLTEQPLAAVSSSGVNGIKPSLSPVKTKAAKKYIPDQVDQHSLVIPRVDKGLSKKENKKKKKSKKSRSKEKLKSEQMKALEELCELVRLGCYVSRSPKRKKTETATKTSDGLPAGFTFKRVTYEVKHNPLIPFDQIPPPPRDVMLQHRAQAPASSPTASKKRKQFAVKDRGNRLRDSGSDLSISSESTGSDLQRLPLKKRHHHNSSTPENRAKVTTTSRRPTYKFGVSDPLMPRIFPAGKLGSSTLLEKTKLLKSFHDLINPEESVAGTAPAKESKRRSGRSRKSASSVSDASPEASTEVVPLPSVSKFLIQPTNVLVVKEVIATPPEIRNKRKNSRRLESSSGSDSPTVSPRKKVKSEVHIAPMEVLEVYDVEVFKEKEELTLLNDNEMLTVSVPSAVTDATSIGTPLEGTPHSSSTTPNRSSSGGIKPIRTKRRRPNKTGFPSTKKKKPKQTKSFPEGILTPQSSGVEESGNESAITLDETAAETTEDESIMMKLENVEATDDEASTAETEAGTEESKALEPLETTADGTLLGDDEKFSASLTERVKIRRRKSVDNLMALVESGDLNIPGLCKSLLNVPDPPVIVPPKTNYLPAGMLGNFFKRASICDPVPPKQDPSPPVVTESPRGKKKKAKTESLPWSSKILPASEYPTGMHLKKLDTYLLPYDVWCYGVIHTRTLFEEWKEKRKEEIEAAAEARKSERRRKSESTKRVRKSIMPENAPPSWKFKKIRQSKSHVLFISQKLYV